MWTIRYNSLCRYIYNFLTIICILYENEAIYYCIWYHIIIYLLMVNTQMIQTKFMSNKLQIHPLPMVFSSLYRNEKFWSSRDDYGTIVCYNSK